jgi:hypothetical protein
VRFRHVFRVTVAVAALLAVAIAHAAAAGLADLSASDPDFDPILTLQSAGVVDGYPDGTFRPDEPITRAEFVKMVLLTADPHARDIPVATACNNALMRYNDAADAGSLTTYVCQAWFMTALLPDGHFHPSAHIPRGEAAREVVNRVEICMYAYTAPYSDVASSEFAGEIRILYGLGWFRPEGSRFGPQKPLLRREAAVMLARALPEARGAQECIAARTSSDQH